MYLIEIFNLSPAVDSIFKAGFYELQNEWQDENPSLKLLPVFEIRRLINEEIGTENPVEFDVLIYSSPKLHDLLKVGVTMRMLVSRVTFVLLACLFACCLFCFCVFSSSFIFIVFFLDFFFFVFCFYFCFIVCLFLFLSLFFIRNRPWFGDL